MCTSFCVCWAGGSEDKCLKIKDQGFAALRNKSRASMLNLDNSSQHSPTILDTCLLYIIRWSTSIGFESTSAGAYEPQLAPQPVPPLCLSSLPPIPPSPTHETSPAQPGFSQSLPSNASNSSTAPCHPTPTAPRRSTSNPISVCTAYRRSVSGISCPRRTRSRHGGTGGPTCNSSGYGARLYRTILG